MRDGLRVGRRQNKLPAPNGVGGIARLYHTDKGWRLTCPSCKHKEYLYPKLQWRQIRHIEYINCSHCDTKLQIIEHIQ